jgi:hypothetical protein
MRISQFVLISLIIGVGISWTVPVHASERYATASKASSADATSYGDTACDTAYCAGKTCDVGCDDYAQIRAAGLCCCNSGIIGGAELTVLRPQLRANYAFTIAQAAPDFDNPTTTTYTSDFFNYSYAAAPRIWLGNVGANGFGGRVRWWFFDEDSSTETFTSTANSLASFDVILPSAKDFEDPHLGLTTHVGLVGDTLTATSNLRAYTLDADVMQQFEACHWIINLGGGLRDLSVVQTFSGVAIHVADVGRSIPATRDTFNLTNRFDGVGPSVFAELKRPFCCSGLALVANVRASEVFGSPTVRAMQVNGIGKEPITQTWDLAPQTSALSLTELQLGAEWARDLGRSSLFAQALWEAQYWINTGNTLVPLADNLSLVGVTFRVGLKH